MLARVTVCDSEYAALALIGSLESQSLTRDRETSTSRSEELAQR
jgi:hypothetical protein